jgi:hypothetical protein
LSSFGVGRFAVVHAGIDFGVVGGREELATVISPDISSADPNSDFAKVLIRDQSLTPPVIYRGGRIGLDLRLYSAPGDDWAQHFLTLAKTVTDVAMIGSLRPLFAVAEPLKKAFRDLSGSGRVLLEAGMKIDLSHRELADHQYLALLAHPKGKILPADLRVDRGALMVGSLPIEDTDFVLLEVDRTAERPDLAELDISRRGADFLKDVAKHLAEGGVREPVTEKYRLFVAQVFSTEHLNTADRARVLAGVRKRMQELTEIFSGLTSDPATRTRSGAGPEIVRNLERSKPGLLKPDLAADAPVELGKSISSALEFS